MSKFSRSIRPGRYTADRRINAVDRPVPEVAPVTSRHHERLHGVLSTGSSRQEAEMAFAGRGVVKPEPPTVGRIGRGSFAVGPDPQAARANLRAARAAGAIPSYERRPPPRPGPVAKVAPMTARDLADDDDEE